MISIELENPRREIEQAIEQNDLAQLLRVSGLLHGHFCPGSAMGVKAATRAVRELRTQSTGMEEVVAIVETNSCFSDGVQIVTGCSFGNNALIYRDFGKMVLTLARRSGEAVRVTQRPDGLSMEQREPEAMKLFQKVVKERKGTPEDSEKLRGLWTKASFKMLDVPDEEIFSITHLKIKVPAYARIFASVKCSVCGENIMEPRARIQENKPVCLSCAGDQYYQLAGDGMSLVGR
jgi:formylmethanofuran dehydrogenase subunit E